MTFKSADKANDIMKIRNRSYRDANDTKNLCVMVEGPNENEYTLMDVREASGNGFLYTWSY